MIDKTAEERAREWQEAKTDDWFDTTPPADQVEEAFLAGRADFIEHDLFELLIRAYNAGCVNGIGSGEKRAEKMDNLMRVAKGEA